MKIPPAFAKLVQWFDCEIYDVSPEEHENYTAFAVKNLSQAEKKIVKAFISQALETMVAPGRLSTMWENSGARNRYQTEEMLRWQLEDIVENIADTKK